MKGVSCLFVAALIRVNQDGKHPELLLDLRLARFRTNFEDVIWVYESVIEQSIQLMILVKLGVFLGQLSHLEHYLLKLLLH